MAVFKPQNQNSVDFADETNFSGDAVAVRIIHRVGAVLADNVPLAEVGNSVDALQQSLVALAAQRFLVDVPVPPVGQETDVFAGWQRQQRFLGVFFKEAKFAVADAAEISIGKFVHVADSPEQISQRHVVFGFAAQTVCHAGLSVAFFGRHLCQSQVDQTGDVFARSGIQRCFCAHGSVRIVEKDFAVVVKGQHIAAAENSEAVVDRIHLVSLFVKQLPIIRQPGRFGGRAAIEGFETGVVGKPFSGVSGHQRRSFADGNFAGRNARITAVELDEVVAGAAVNPVVLVVIQGFDAVLQQNNPVAGKRYKTRNVVKNKPSVAREHTVFAAETDFAGTGHVVGRFVKQNVTSVFENVCAFGTDIFFNQISLPVIQCEETLTFFVGKMQGVTAVGKG